MAEDSVDKNVTESEEDDAECPEFPDLVHQIQEILDDWEAVVPRSNWGVPKDAEWITTKGARGKALRANPISKPKSISVKLL